jgi:hypothetical protein
VSETTIRFNVSVVDLKVIINNLNSY